MISVIIPTFNSAAHVAETISIFRDEETIGEILIVDGGSSDDTQNIVEGAGGTFLSSPEKGRGNQLRYGVQKAKGSWLLFIHSDTTLEAGWLRDVSDFMALPDHKEKAAYFMFGLDDNTKSSLQLEKMVAWRCQKLGLPYGDQGLLIHRDFYDQLGGYKNIALMEDVDLVRRIGKKRLIGLKTRAVTSADKYRRDGYKWRSVKNIFCLSLYFLGVSPDRIKRIYG